MNFVSMKRTTAFVPSQEKYVVKKQGSFPSVTLKSGTSGDNPSTATAKSMYFYKQFDGLGALRDASDNNK